VGLTLEEAGGWPAVLGSLTSRESLTSETAAAAFESVLSGEATPAQVAAFASALRTKGETVEEMRAFVSVMRARSELVAVEGEIVDTCGTGGDKSGSINVSTMAALVVAAAGARVCKHGGRASSSLAGSADVFEELGVWVDLGPLGVARCIEQAGIGFCLAPRFHPAMRHVAPVRKELGVPTVFNFLGPLANPAGATRQLIGVGDVTMAEKMLAVLDANGARHAMVVHGEDGLDELSIGGSTAVLELKRDDATGEGLIARYELDATDFGIGHASLSELRGGDPARNASLVRAVLKGENGPHRDFVVWNSAAALVVAGKAAEMAEGISLASSLLDSGEVARVLDRLVTVSIEAAALGLS
jgi:anthranilate phosphoribosyltransferase